MSKPASLLLIAMLLTLANAPMSKSPSEVMLDASQVTSARDIEAAIEAATAYGTRPGTVTLDGSKGTFEYTGDDRSINLYYSNITIRSFNWATIGNCDDGVFFDDFPANNILIEGVELVCLDGHSVYAPFLGQHHNVILRNNYFETGAYPAIAALQGDSWTITGNQILSMGTAVYLNETGGTRIRHNRIQAKVGVELYNSGYDNVVFGNDITGWERGVVISGKTLGNIIASNRMDRIQEAGIVFVDIVAGNRVTGNRITCWPDVPCVAVIADPLNYQQNRIAGNTLTKGK